MCNKQFFFLNQSQKNVNIKIVYAGKTLKIFLSKTSGMCQTSPYISTHCRFHIAAGMELNKSYPVHPSFCTFVRHTNGVSSLKLNSFDQNFMKLGHIVKYHNVFFKFDNVHIAPCLQELLPFVHDDLPFLMMSSL